MLMRSLLRLFDEKTWSCRWVLADLVHHSQWMNAAPTIMPIFETETQGNGRDEKGHLVLKT